MIAATGNGTKKLISLAGAMSSTAKDLLKYAKINIYEKESRNDDENIGISLLESLQKSNDE